MPRQKSKTATTYHQQPNALSALVIYTVMSYHFFQTLCAISLTRGHGILMLSMIVDEDESQKIGFLVFSHST